MGDFKADIPPPPSDAPGMGNTTYKDWENYVNRKVKENEVQRINDGYGSYPRIFIRNFKVTIDSVELAINGTEPSPWNLCGTDTENWLFYKWDYKTWCRDYVRLTFQNFHRITVSFDIEYRTHIGAFLPDVKVYHIEESFYIPFGQTRTDGPYKERRRKLASWGWFASPSIGIGDKVQGGVQGQIGGEGTDEEPPSEHPAPKRDGLEKKKPAPDESLKNTFAIGIKDAFAPVFDSGQLSLNTPLTNPEFLKKITLDDMAFARNSTTPEEFINKLTQRQKLRQNDKDESGPFEEINL